MIITVLSEECFEVQETVTGITRQTISTKKLYVLNYNLVYNIRLQLCP